MHYPICGAAPIGYHLFPQSLSWSLPMALVKTITVLMPLLCAALFPQAALADVNVRTPWSSVYVGPGGVQVDGPWGGVNVPARGREKGCEAWRESVEDYYDDYDCDVDFRDNGCAIEEIECDD